MKLLFIQSDPFAWTGKMSISAVLKKAGHDCDVLIEPAEKNLIESIKKVEPDIIAFSATTGVHMWVLAKAKEIKENFNVPILLAGSHATYFPQILGDENLDFICVGEGEEAIVELLDNLEKNKDVTNIQNIWAKKDNKIYQNPIRPLIQDLDSLPFPDRGLYYKRYSFLRDQHSRDFVFMRGCPFPCAFCYNHSMKKLYAGKGNYVRFRSVESVIGELLDVKNNWGLGSAMLFDEVMFFDKKWLSDFFIQYKQIINVPFVTEVRADLIDEEVVHGLKEAGCICIRMGVESGSNKLRNEVLKKVLTNEQIEKAAKILKKEKILIETYNMIGFPKETLEDAFETIRFNKKIKADYAWCAIFHPYPKTDLAELAIKENLIDKNFWEKMGPSFFMETPMKLKNNKEIVNLQRFFALTVKLHLPIPLIRLLIKAPNNKVYDLIFKAGYIYLTLKTTNIGVKGIFKLGKSTKNYFVKKVED